MLEISTDYEGTFYVPAEEKELMVIFTNCANLEEFSVDGNAEFGGKVFYSCPNLKSINVEGNIKLRGGNFLGGAIDLEDFSCRNLSEIVSAVERFIEKDCSFYKNNKVLFLKSKLLN